MPLATPQRKRSHDLGVFELLTDPDDDSPHGHFPEYTMEGEDFSCHITEAKYTGSYYKTHRRQKKVFDSEHMEEE